MDYNIYIHNVNETSANDSPTKPWDISAPNSQTTPWKNVTSSSSELKGSSHFTSPVAAFKGVANAIKAHPVIATAIMVLKISDKIITTVEPFVTRETGDYRFNTLYNSLKSNLGVIFNPIGSTLSALKQYQELKIENQSREQKRLLIGEGFINSSLRRI